MKDIRKVQNIVLVSLADKFCKGVAIIFAQSLDMYNVDLKDMIAYDLINPKEVLSKCGIDYLRKRERGVVESVTQFQNTVVSCSFEIFNDNKELFAQSFVIYLKLPLNAIEGTLNQIDYDFRNKFLSENSDSTVMLSNKIKKNAIKEIMKSLKGE